MCRIINTDQRGADSTQKEGALVSSDQAESLRLSDLDLMPPKELALSHALYKKAGLIVCTLAVIFLTPQLWRMWSWQTVWAGVTSIVMFTASIALAVAVHKYIRPRAFRMEGGNWYLYGALHVSPVGKDIVWRDVRPLLCKASLVLAVAGTLLSIYSW